MANEICFRTLHLDKPWTLDTYLGAGGYTQWKKILLEKFRRKKSLRQSRFPLCADAAARDFPPD